MFHRTQYINCPNCLLADNLCFYIDNRNDEDINSFLTRNYRELQTEFRAKDMELVYLPMLSENIGNEVMKYVAGDTVSLDSKPENFRGILPDVVVDNIYDPCMVHFDKFMKRFEIAHFAGPAHDHPDLYLHTIVVEFSHDRRVSYVEPYNLSEPAADSGRRFSYGQSDNSHIRANYEGEAPTHSHVRYSLEIPRIEPYKPVNREDKESHELDLENQELIHNIKRMLDKLRDRGLSEERLRLLLAPVQKLSRLTITKDYRFILTDYDNKEVKLSPLQKALFVFYLRHPEGIPFKLLVDYKDEMKKIYHDIDGWNFIRQNKRIENICNPLRNTVNENVSRIRNAFRAVIDESLAKNYFITGNKGEAMSIPLSRELVVWE